MTRHGAAPAASEPEREQRRIEAEASAWLVRLNEGAHSPADQAGFEAWMLADERHAETFEAVSRTWEDMGELRHLRYMADAEQPRSMATRIAAALQHIWSPAPMFSAALACLTLAALVLFAPSLLRQPDARFDTPIAEIRTISLADGSAVTLGARSVIEVAFSEAERRVVLRSGEAFFDVAHDENRPFFVDAGGPLVRVVGTKFNVHRSDDQVSVAVLEGVVRVARSGADEPNSIQTLEAGQRAAFERRPFFSPEPAAPVLIAAVQPAHVAAWRDGRLSYDNAPLSVLVSDVNRYYAPGVALASRDLGDMRITAAFRTDEIPAFLDALASVLPVSVERRAGAHIEVRRAQP